MEQQRVAGLQRLPHSRRSAAWRTVPVLTGGVRCRRRPARREVNHVRGAAPVSGGRPRRISAGRRRRSRPAGSWRVTAYWLAITTLMGALTFSVIPRLVESPGVLGSAQHPLAGPGDRRDHHHRRGDRHPGAADHGGHQRPHAPSARPPQAVHHRRHRDGPRLPCLPGVGVLERAVLAIPDRRRAAPVQQQLRPGPVPGLRPDLVPSRQVGYRVRAAGSREPRRQPHRPRARRPVHRHPAGPPRLPGDHPRPLRGDRAHRGGDDARSPSSGCRIVPRHRTS